METIKKPSSDYYGLKRLIEIGAIASPLVVVFAVYLAPLISESVFLLISHANNAFQNKNACLTFGITGLIVALFVSVFVSIQAYYYFTRTRRGRWFLYCLGCALLVTIIVAITVNSFALKDSAGNIDSATLRSYTTSLQSFIAMSIFTIFNIIFMYAWTHHLKNAGVPRQPDKMINVSKD